jgi:hypothetical protein
MRRCWTARALASAGVLWLVGTIGCSEATSADQQNAALAAPEPSPAASTLAAYLEAQRAPPTEAQQQLTDTALALRKRGAEVVAEVEHAYAATTEEELPRRRELLSALAVADHADAVPFLTGIAVEELPARAPSTSELAWERHSALRSHALDVLAQLGQNGHRGAEAALVQVLAHGDSALALTAMTKLVEVAPGKVHALLMARDPVLRAAAAKVLYGHLPGVLAKEEETSR